MRSNGWGRLGGGIALVGTGAKPVVESLLVAAAGLHGVQCFGLADEGFSLAALDALGEELLTAVRGFRFGGGDAGQKDPGAPARGFGGGEPRDAIDDIAAARAGRDVLSSPPLLCPGRSQGALQAAKFSQGGLKRHLMLFLFEIANAEEAAKGIGDGQFTPPMPVRRGGGACRRSEPARRHPG